MSVLDLADGSSMIVQVLGATTKTVAIKITFRDSGRFSIPSPPRFALTQLEIQDTLRDEAVRSRIILEKKIRKG